MGEAARADDAPLAYAWRPQPGPQAALVTCPVSEIFYGGARGGGKTDGMLGKFAIKAQRYGKDCVGVFFRKTREDLKEAIERSQDVYGPVGAKFNEHKKWWRFPNGARLKFEYLENPRDAMNYQGHSYTDLFFEELQTWADPSPINKLRATLRSAAGVPCQFHATGNPGGPGHQWVKQRFIDPAPLGWKVLWEEFTNPFTGEVTRKDRIFIPARLTDNAFYGSEYVASLQQSGSEQLVRAWLLGDWDIIEGAFFDCWEARKHVVRPFEIPADWIRFRALDWGSARPFAAGWFAVVQDDYEHESGVLPRGALVMYREWYGVRETQAGIEPNVGLKMTVEQVAQGIEDRSRPDMAKANGGTYAYSVADPSIGKRDGGPSMQERIFTATGDFWRKGDNARVARQGHIGGWDQVRQRLLGDERPMLYVFSTCTHLIRTLPTLQHDEANLEDLDTDGEDHAADMLRYAAMSRPYTRQVKVEPKPEWPQEQTVGEMIKRHIKAADNRVRI